MKKAILIAEKKSLKDDIQRVYEKHKSEIPYDIDFYVQRGHLLTLLYPDEIDEAYKTWSFDNLPFFPEENGGWKYKMIKGSEKLFLQIKDALASDKYDVVIHAGDPDQEGELLVNLVLRQCNNKLPVLRFWTNDTTEKSVLEELKDLHMDNEPKYKNFYHAALTRQRMDYLYGMNGSRAATIKLGDRVAIGRVKTFVQKMVVDREDAIKNFVPSTSYGIKASFDNNIIGQFFEDSSDKKSEENEELGFVYYEKKEEANNKINSLEKEGTIVLSESKESKTYAPKLFKLSTLQIELGKKGMHSDDVLATVQSLYEKKYLTYPRTDCEYISSNIDCITILKQLCKDETLREIIKGISTKDIERVRRMSTYVNDKELESHGHSALCPTIESGSMDLLSVNEKLVFLTVAKRFIAIFLPPLVQNKIKVITAVGNDKFKTTGKTVVDYGFTKFLGSDVKDSPVPLAHKGDHVHVTSFDFIEKTTTYQINQRY